jgi:TolB protein
MRFPFRARLKVRIAAWAAFSFAATTLVASATEFRMIAHDPMGGTDAAISTDGRYIATSSRRSGELNLWLFDIGSGRWSQLTEGAGEDSEPRWSPDGGWIVFTSTRGGSKNIWSLRLADRSLRELSDGDGESEYPSWSPDGRWIVYTGGEWKARKFYLIAPDGIGRHPISRTPSHVGACSFFPDGMSVVCHSYENGVGRIERLTLDGQLISRLTDGAWDYKPEATPDGQWIAFSRLEGKRVEIWAVPATGGLPHRVVKSLDQDRWPMFTRKGELFFHRIVDLGASIRLLDRTTGKVMTVVEEQEHPQQASFSPDAQQIAYCAEIQERLGVRILDRTTGQRSSLDFGGHEACFPRWSPDGSKIAAIVRDSGSWHVSTVNSNGSDMRIYEAPATAKVFEGPLDWSPDGSTLSFMAITAPYESDIFLLNAGSGLTVNVTADSWYDEAPAFTADGKGLTFMSTRGGDWTWGLFQWSLASGSVTPIANPDHIEKNFPRIAADGSMLWTQLDPCMGLPLLAVRSRGGVAEFQSENPGAAWPSFSADGKEVLFTVVLHDVQYWIHPELKAQLRD